MKIQNSKSTDKKDFSIFSEQRLLNYVAFKKNHLGCIRNDNPKSARLIDLNNLVNRNILIIEKIEKHIIWFKINSKYLNSVIATFKKQKELNLRLF